VNKLIQQIIEIEDMAQEVVEGAREKKNNISSVINADINKMKAEIKANAENEKIKRIESSDKITGKRIAEVRDDGIRKIEMLDRKYAENKEKWKSELFDRIING